MNTKTPLCRHLKTSGAHCKSPAMSYSDYCYFHDRLHRRHKSFRYTNQTKNHLYPGRDIQLPPLEDAESVQLAIAVVVNALAVGDLQTGRATALLYGLQVAYANAKYLAATPKPEEPGEIVRQYAITPGSHPRHRARHP